MAEIYPLPMRVPLQGGRALSVVIDRQAWRFATSEDEARFRALPVNIRLDLRRQFEAQVELAKSTPKGER